MSAKSLPPGDDNLSRDSLREGDHGLGIPRSRIEGARVLNEEDSTDRDRKPDVGLPRQSEERPRQLDAASETFPLSNGGGVTRDSLREGDRGLGIPQSRVEGTRTLSEEDIAEDLRRHDAELQHQFEVRLRQIDTAKDSFRLPAGLLRITTWIGLTIASVLGLLLVGQGAALISDIKNMPTPLDWIAGVSATLFATLLGFLILKLGIALFRLHRIPATRLRGLRKLRVLAQQKRWNKFASRHFSQIKDDLKQYLYGYEFDDNTSRRLGELGLSDEDCGKLKEARHFLLNQGARFPGDDWLLEYQRRFQRILDDTARRRVNHYAFKVAAGTAVARVAVFDQAIVLYSSVALVKDLMLIYGLRPEFSQVTVILASSIRNTYLAGPMQDISEDGIVAMLEEIVPDLSVNKLGEKIGASVVEALMNRALILRLGQQTIQLLQPVHPGKPS